MNGKYVIHFCEYFSEPFQGAEHSSDGTNTLELCLKIITDSFA